MSSRKPGIRVRCKNCDKRLHLNPDLLGKKIRCPKCGAAITVKRTRPKRKKKPSQDFIDLPESIDQDEFGNVGSSAGNCSSGGYGYYAEEILPLPPRTVSRKSSRSRGRSLPPGSLANARAIRKRYIRHEVGSIKMIGVLYIVNGVLFLLVAFAVLFIPDEKNISTTQKFLMTIFMLSMGVGLLFTGIKLRTLEYWTRIPIAILSGIGVLGFPFGTLLHGWILYLVFSEKGSYIFSDEYKDIIAATPDIRNRSHSDMDIFLNSSFPGSGFLRHLWHVIPIE